MINISKQMWGQNKLNFEVFFFIIMPRKQGSLATKNYLQQYNTIKRLWI